jgi:hypothetical protein
MKRIINSVGYRVGMFALWLERFCSGLFHGKQCDKEGTTAQYGYRRCIRSMGHFGSCHYYDGRKFSGANSLDPLTLKDWQMRVIEEKNQLDAKIDKLQMFLKYAALDKCDDKETDALNRQLNAMRQYSMTLGERIMRFYGYREG